MQIQFQEWHFLGHPVFISMRIELSKFVPISEKVKIDFLYEK